MQTRYIFSLPYVSTYQEQGLSYPISVWKSADKLRVDSGDGSNSHAVNSLITLPNVQFEVAPRIDRLHCLRLEPSDDIELQDTVRPSLPSSYDHVRLREAKEGNEVSSPQHVRSRGALISTAERSRPNCVPQVWPQAFAVHASNAVLPNMAHWEFRGSEILGSRDVDLWELEQKCAPPSPPALHSSNTGLLSILSGLTQVHIKPGGMCH